MTAPHPPRIAVAPRSQDCAAASAGEEWKIDRHIPVALIMAILFQSFAVIWWAARIETRVNALETQLSQNAQLIDRVSRMEEKVSALRDASLRIERKLDNLKK